MTNTPPSYDEIHTRHLAIALLVDKIRREAAPLSSIGAGEHILSLLAPLDEHLTTAIGQHVRSRKEQP